MLDIVKFSLLELPWLLALML